MIEKLIDKNMILSEDEIKVITIDEHDEHNVFVIRQKEVKHIIILNSLVEAIQERLIDKGKEEAITMIVIAEEPRYGRVYRWNNHCKNEWCEIGATCGYA